MKLRRNQYCPIHRSLSCCGRELVQKESRDAEVAQPQDRRTKQAMRHCEVAFTNYGDIVPDHIDPRGMGGSRRDDHPENIQAMHF
jgi:hypothetical protein